MSGSLGVLSVQGDYAKHFDAISRCPDPPTTFEVRTPDDLAQVDRLIIPGGESTTVGLLTRRTGLDQAIQERAAEGMPIWGTCMGMILMAKEIEGSNQFRLSIMDITVRRNAFGAQVHSFEDSVAVEGFKEPITAVFIRAPVITRHGEEARALATYEGQIVAVRQGNLLGTSFHPEMTDDTRLHEWFLSW